MGSGRKRGKIPPSTVFTVKTKPSIQENFVGERLVASTRQGRSRATCLGGTRKTLGAQS